MTIGIKYSGLMSPHEINSSIGKEVIPDLDLFTFIQTSYNLI